MADDIKTSDFMCTCSPEERERSEKCYKDVLEELKTTPEDFLDAVVYNLQWALGDKEKRYEENSAVGSIEGIGCDMWCGVSASVQLYNEDAAKFQKPIHIWVQCDKVEHGIARVWQIANEIALKA